ncbi:hypothetical protein C8A03DRAFT_42435 [Achaetomium macrosporum]|uniref:Uncharacterized protein n=1 Tax=Achaetomium macrosporum TaxID=79813 RepID=A0AAN7HGX1_9PEZI|nr:hypothetical protein C8A03DRAFT_42435 [Achaetomium macrosporum]
MAPSPGPHERPSSYGSDLPPPTTTTPTAQRTVAAPPPPQPATAPPSNGPAAQRRSGSGSPRAAGAAVGSQKSSPPSASRNGERPKIVVKKEPGSPGLPTARHRPKKLDLSRNTSIVSPATGRPLTAREGALGIQEVGIACLSPGFVPKDATEQEQLNRSMSVREHQRQIIEARLQQQSAKMGDGPDKDHNGSHFAAKTPGLARKRGAPPGLSIVAPSPQQFANERVIQSAPLGQTFTGRHNPHPLTRHITNQPSNLASTSHIHHVPATQTSNRLPPIADVFGQNLSGHPDSSGHALFAGQNQNRGPLPSPHHPPPPPPQPNRSREYKSAEEAQVELAGGRPELLPKLVRYGGHQPPTPPSPPHPHAREQAPHPHHQHPTGGQTHNHSRPPPPPGLSDNRSVAGAATAALLTASATGPTSSSMKRRRDQYEEGGSPPLGNGARPAPAAPLPFSSSMGGSARRGPFGEGRDSPDTIEAKKEEFLALCARAWDLFHS